MGNLKPNIGEEETDAANNSQIKFLVEKRKM